MKNILILIVIGILLFMGLQLVGNSLNSLQVHNSQLEEVLNSK